MIFGENTTMLGASTIPMAEGYDGSEGIAVALVEAARNDRTMFNFMIRSDIRESNICKESAGVVMEGEVTALHEAVGGGIFRKIAELFKKLVAKVKSIFHTFMSKINGLFMKDKELVKKYEKELVLKKNINNLEVKWRKVKSRLHLSFELISEDFDAKSGKYHEEEFDRVKEFLPGTSADSVEEFKTEYVEEALEDEDTVKLSEIGGVRAIISYLGSYDKELKKMQSNIKKSTSNLEKIVKKYEKLAVDSGKAASSNDTMTDAYKAKTADANLDSARHDYEMAQAYQTAMLAVMDAVMTCVKIDYKQNKAAFMKAIAANGKKLEESAIYLDAVAEAAEEEVEAVIDGALKGEDISDVSLASKDVKDAGVSDDFGKITDGPDTYLGTEKDTVDGTIDTVYDSKNEAARFASLLY